VETEPLIGFFVNILPMRMRFAGDPTFSEVLGSQRDTALGAYAHQDIPFDKLVEELRPERSSTHNPLVQVLFVMQNTPQPVKEFGGLKLGPLGVSSTSRFDLVLFINDPEGNACATWMYNPNLFDDFTIARIARVYEVLLQTVATDPDITISNLAEHLAAAERKYQLDEQKKFEEASVRKLKGIKRRAVTQA
jgi:non-ribosomal peptide synthetase component F